MINFGKYQLWDFRGDEVDEVSKAISNGEVDGVFIGRSRGFLKSSLECLLGIKNLSVLAIGDVLNIEVNALNLLKNLEFLSIGEVSSKCEINLLNFSNLKQLSFAQQKNINLPPSGLPKLKELAIWSFSGVTLEIMNAYLQLERLELIQAKKLEALSGLDACIKLKHASFAYCPKLVDINALQELINLETLDIEKAQKIKSHISIEFLTELKKLRLNNVGALTDLNFVSKLTKLESFVLRGSPLMSNDLKPLLKLPKLNHIYLDQKTAYQPTLSEINELVASRNLTMKIRPIHTN